MKFRWTWTWGLVWLVIGLMVLPSGQTTLRAVGHSVSAQATAPFHQNLSVSNVDAAYPDIEANATVMAVAWSKGKDAQNTEGSIYLKWRSSSDGKWKAPNPQIAERTEGLYDHQEPAMAVRDLGGGAAEFHIVWVQYHYAGGGATTDTTIRYKKCTLASPTASNLTCSSAERLSYDSNTTQVARSGPTIAVDGSGVPHIIWSEKDQTLVDKPSHLYYNNRSGGVWGNSNRGWPITIGPAAQDQTPAMAVDASYVYVAWDDNRNHDQAGIYFARRDSLGALPALETEEQAKWTKRKISNTGSSTITTDKSQFDGQPTVTQGGHGVYVMWQRLESKYSEECYQHSLAYRVFEGPSVSDDWWPGGAVIDWAKPFTYTTHSVGGVSGLDDFYSGVRPAIAVVTDVLHVAWQYDSAKACTGSGGESVPYVWAASEADAAPIYVGYAHADHQTLPADPASLEWSSPLTITAQSSRYFFANPDLAVFSNSDHPHIALQKRFLSGTDVYAWDVWYVNDQIRYYVYLPAALKNSR